MINLISPELQQELKAARLNVRLRSYLIMIGCATITIIAAFGAGYYITIQSRQAAEKSIAEHETQITDYSQIRSQAEKFSKDLSIAKSILSQEILYSDLIVQITKTLPSNTILTDLSLNEEMLGEPMVLSARIPTKQDALILKAALEESPIFSEVNLVNVQNSPSASSSYGKQPVAVTVNATLDPTAETKEASR